MPTSHEDKDRAMIKDGSTPEQGAPPNVELWSRDGFAGDIAILIRPYYTPDYHAVDGPHAPHQLDLRRVDTADRRSAEAMPTPCLVGRDGTRLSVSARQAPMPFSVRNVEADELHFVQDGEIEITTDHGVITAGPGDFVCIPRAVTYRTRPLSQATLVYLLETPGAVRLDPPAPFGMINMALDVHRPALAPPPPPGQGAVLMVKCLEGVTRYELPHDPLAAVALAGGQPPAWKLSLRKIAPLTYEPLGGPPAHFAASTGKDVLVYNIGSRRTGRPPVHLNVDYDELIFFHAGPGVYGGLNEPGLMSWTPKGIAHHGPPEDVPEGYSAWMVETRTTLRLTAAGAAAARLMETSSYGVHPTLG